MMQSFVYRYQVHFENRFIVTCIASSNGRSKNRFNLLCGLGKMIIGELSYGAAQYLLNRQLVRQPVYVDGFRILHLYHVITEGEYQTSPVYLDLFTCLLSQTVPPRQK